MSPVSLKLPSQSTAALGAKHRRRSHGTCRRWNTVKVRAQLQNKTDSELRIGNLQSAAVAVAAAAWIALCNPAVAEIQTVPLNEATNMAKALQKKPVNKGRIWLLMVLGGAALFGATVLLENNDKLFPAISKANKAMSSSKAKKPKQQQEAAVIDVAYEEEQQRRLAAVQAEREADAKAQQAVVAGLQQAEQGVLGSKASFSGTVADATAVSEDEVSTSSKQPSINAGTSAAAIAGSSAAAADAKAQDQHEEAAFSLAPGTADLEAEADAKAYPPLIFEPGSLDKVRKNRDGAESTPQALQGMSDEQLEAAFRQRQKEMEKQQQQQQ